MKKIFVLLSPLIAFIIYVTLSSSSGGINGVSVSGCTCHGAASSNTIVTIGGLPAGGYIAGTVYPLTITVTNTVITGTNKRAGFDLTTTTGAFTAVAGTALNGPLEIRHNITPQLAPTGTATWTFNWTAPATGNANATFNLAGNFTNGDGGTGGDQWNLTSSTIIKAGTPLTASATSTSIACNGGTSTITASGIGGVPPYQYQRNAAAFQTSPTFSSNLTGTYTITVRDGSLGTASTTITINQPTIIVPNTTNTPILCNGGTSTITASATGGTGTFMYSRNAGTFQSSPTFTGNLAGSYTITARDASLCTKTTTLIITQPTLLVINSATPTPALCNGGATGSMNVVASGGTSTKTYTISPLGPQSNTTGSFSGLTAQSYTVTVTDANLCTKTSAVVVTQPSAMNFGSPTLSPPPCTGGTSTLSITATGGTGAKTYTINPLGPQSNATGNFTGLTAQVYTITAADANGCATTATVTVTDVPCNTILNLTLHLQGYYIGGGMMTTTLANQGITPTGLNDVDDITVSLCDPLFTPVANTTARLQTNGTAMCTFSSPLNGLYWIKVEHRNHIATWSANTVALSSTTPTNYNFTNLITQAFMSNMFEVDPGVYGFYSGDINQDLVVDALDYVQLDPDLIVGLAGYLATDLNGDGVVDALDYVLFDPNLIVGVGSAGPK